MQFRRAIFAALLTAAMIGLGRPAFARDYVITSGDQITVKVAGEPDFGTPATKDTPAVDGKTCVVSDEGTISLPLIGKVSVIGKTEAEAKAELTTRLKKYLKNPDVSVEVLNPLTTVSVTGEVKTPNDSIRVKPETRILDVITKAGGVTDAADKKNIVIQRGTTRISVDLKAAESGEVSANIPVEYNDRIIVPKLEGYFTKRDTVGKIKVLGEVTTAGEKDLSEKMTPWEAINGAGGFKETANRRNVTLMHKDGTKVSLDLDAVSRGQSDPLMENLYLSDGDVLQVSDYGKVRVDGDVKTPGEVALTGSMNLLGAIQKQGGFADTADQTSVTITRSDGKVDTVNVAKLMKGEIPATAAVLKLKADDIIFVPNNKENRVVVTGPGVKKPGSITFEEGMTAFDAITQAEGFQDKARTDKVVVVPKGGKPIVANLKRFASTGDTSMNPTLQPGATVLVDVKQEKASGNDSWLKQTLTSTLSYIPTMYISKWIWD
jgi:polysaccharide export outer membrane protein